MLFIDVLINRPLEGINFRVFSFCYSQRKNIPAISTIK
jgi:hypothetical protein